MHFARVWAARTDPRGLFPRTTKKFTQVRARNKNEEARGKPGQSHAVIDEPYQLTLASLLRGKPARHTRSIFLTKARPDVPPATTPKPRAEAEHRGITSRAAALKVGGLPFRLKGQKSRRLINPNKITTPRM